MRYICLLLLCLLSLDASGQDWKRLPPSPAGFLDLADEKHLMVFGPDSMLLSDDGGMTWYRRSIPGGGKYHLHSAKRTSDSTILICGYRDDEYYTMWTALRWISVDSGRSWNYDGNGFPSGYTSAMIVDRTTSSWFHGYGQPPAGRGYSRLNGGSHSIKYNIDEREPGGMPKLLMSIDARDSQAYVLLGQNKFKTLRTTNAGVSWSALDSFDSEPGYVRAGSNDRWFVSSNQSLYKYSESGERLDTALKAPAKILDFQFRGPIGFLGLLGADYLLASTDSGTTWFAQSMDNSVSASKLYIPSDSVAYAQTRDGIIKLDTRTASATPVLHVNRIIELGKISEDSMIEQTVVLQNVGSQTLQLGAISSTSGSVTMLTVDQSELLPNASTNMRFRYKLTDDANDSARITILTNTSTGSEQISVRAQVAPKAEVSIRSAAASRLLVFPNPSSSTITLSGDQSQTHSVEIMNTLGVSVLHSEGAGEIDVSHLPPGLYFVAARNDNGSASFAKFVKQ